MTVGDQHVTVAPPDWVTKRCVDCKEKYAVNKDHKGPFRCSRCEDKHERLIKKRKLYRERYRKAKAKMLKRNPNWPGRGER